MQLKEEGWVLKGGMFGSTETSQWLIADASPAAIGGLCRTSLRQRNRRTYQTSSQAVLVSLRLERERGKRERGNLPLHRFSGREGGTFNIRIRYMFRIMLCQIICKKK